MSCQTPCIKGAVALDLQPTTGPGGGITTFIDPALLKLGAPPLELGAPPLELGAPPLELRAPPLELRAPPLELRAPPLELRAPPLELRAPPLGPPAESAEGELTFACSLVQATAQTIDR
jgi:hypothetical protein